MNQANNQSELHSLVALLDDPDPDVFESIYPRLLDCTIQDLGLLKVKYEESSDLLQKTRLENIIYSIKHKFLDSSINRWIAKDKSLFEFLIIFHKVEYPYIHTDKVIEKMSEHKINIWLKFTEGMETFEKIKVINDYLFAKEGFEGDDETFDSVENSHLWSVLERKKGNQVLLSTIYLILAQNLEVPVHGVNFPQYFMLCYQNKSNPNQPLFYISPFDYGVILYKQELEKLLRKMGYESKSHYFKPCSKMDVANRILCNMERSYKIEKNHLGVEMIALLQKKYFDL